MIDKLLMLQLGFNVVMLGAILLLARAGGRKAESAVAGTTDRESRRARRRAERAAKSAPAPAAPTVGTPLDELVARAEREELVAERSLRDRLARLDGGPNPARAEGPTAAEPMPGVANRSEGFPFLREGLKPGRK